MSIYPEASSPIGSPYTPAGGSNMGGGNTTTNPNPNTGPNQMGVGGNSGSMSPVAQQMQSMGRGEDSVLMHMTPGEVGGLQALAQSAGGSLTINPHTGLPEAGFLSSLLPTLLGGLLTLTGVGAPLAALMVGGGTGIATGSLKKGLMAGLGAFGGAGLAGGLTSAFGSGAANAATLGADAAAVGADAATIGSTAAGLGADAATSALTAAPTALEVGAGLGTDIASSIGADAASGIGAAANITPSIANPFAATAADAASNFANPALDLTSQVVGAPAAPANFIGNMFGPKAGQFGEGFSRAAGENLMGTASTPSMMKTGIAALGAGMPVLEAMQPTYKPYEAEEYKSTYEGPYKPTERIARFRGPTPTSDSSEHLYFEDVNPYPGYETVTGGIPEFSPLGMAAGGSTFAPSARGAAYGAGQTAAPPMDINALRAMMTQAPPPARVRPPIPPAAPAAAPAAVGEKLHSFGPAGVAPNLYGLNGLGGYGSGLGSYGGGFGFLSGNDRFPRGNGSVPIAQHTAADYFLNPATGRMELKPAATNPAMAKGGMHLEDGAFIVDARTVSELGNGSSRAGQDILAKHGGQTLRGPGDGVSDSIKANIGGRQEARVARDEVKFSPDAVARIGGGNASQGAKKLYALMDKAHKARKSAKRGQDTGLKGAL